MCQLCCAIKSEYIGDQWSFVIRSGWLKMSDRSCIVLIKHKKVSSCHGSSLGLISWSEWLPQFSSARIIRLVFGMRCIPSWCSGICLFLLEVIEIMHVFYVLTMVKYFFLLGHQCVLLTLQYLQFCMQLTKAYVAKTSVSCFWLNLIRKCSSRSICRYQQHSNEPLQYH